MPHLPIEIDDGIMLDTKAARAYGATLSADYAAADPFPHTVVDGFLPPALIDKIVTNFPARKVEGEELFELGFVGHHKRQVPPAQCSGFNRTLFSFFNSAPVLGFLESVSGIKGLLPDPYFMGGGFHEISRGGHLGIHADFRLNKVLNLHRRLNMLIYLNDGWQDEWGGHLELWDRAMTRKVKSVAPLLNRCVIFNTDADSFHGHPDQLACPPMVTRKSIALYYYTASPNITAEVPDMPTVYTHRPDDAVPKQRSLSLLLDRAMGDLLPPIAQRAIYRLRSKQRAKTKLA